MAAANLDRGLIAALLASVAFTAPAVAQQRPTPTTASAAADEASEIVVLGTRRTDRTLTDSASPVDIIGAAELQSQPSTNVLDVLKDIVPSFFVGQNTISDASTFVRAPSLRGLPADEVLVQLNGKRFNRSALVQVYTGGDTGLSFGSQGSDLSSIPSIAIKSLQILREGATAQYGSDAIAGVLNFGLRDNKTGFEAIARYGQYYDHGDGRSKDIQANLGLALGDRGFVNLSGEYSDDGQDDPQRDAADRADLRPAEPRSRAAAAETIPTRSRPSARRRRTAGRRSSTRATTLPTTVSCISSATRRARTPTRASTTVRRSAAPRSTSAATRTTSAPTGRSTRSI